MIDDLYTQVQAGAGAALATSRVHVVGEVLTYADATRTVSVRPVQQVVRPDGSVVRLPDVHGVPLAAHRLGGFVVAAPASRGDAVLLEVPDQSIDRWLHDGTVADADARRAGRQLAHAVAIPIGGNAGDAFATGGNLVVGRESGGVQLVITPDGKVSLGSSGVDLLDVLYDTLTQLVATTVATLAGPQPLSTAAALAAIQAQLATIRRPS